MPPDREVIDAFVDGRLTSVEHDLMVHHISSCSECTAAVIAALAEAARALAADTTERASGRTTPAPDPISGAAEESPASAVDLLQLDLVLDSRTEQHDLLLRPEAVPEIALRDLAARRAGGGALAPPPSALESIREVPVFEEPPPEQRLVEQSAESPARAEPQTPLARSDEPVAETAESGSIASARAAVAAVAAAHGAAALVEAAAADAPADKESMLPADHSDAASASAHAAVAEEKRPPDVVERQEARDPEPVIPDTRVREPRRLVPPPVFQNGFSYLARVPPAAPVRTARPMRRQQTRRRFSIAGAAVAAIVVLGFAGYGALQLRASAGPELPPPGASTPGDQEMFARSVLAPVLDSAVYGQTVEFATDMTNPMVADSAAPPPAATAPAPDSASAARRRAPLPPIVLAAPVESVGAGNVRPAVATGAATDSIASAVVKGVPPARAAPADATSVARLLRTSTHTVGHVELVLREYDVSAPAPRPGAHEYRWTDETGSRLYVLTGPLDLAALQAFARTLQNGRVR